MDRAACPDSYISTSVFNLLSDIRKVNGFLSLSSVQIARPFVQILPSVYLTVLWCLWSPSVAIVLLFFLANFLSCCDINFQGFTV